MIREILEKPFPAIEKKKHKISISLAFAVSIFVFLIIFQPFGLDDIQYYKTYYILGFFFITLFTMLLCLFALPIIFAKLFDIDNWTVKKDILFMLLQIMIIAIFNWIYNSTIGKDITRQYNIFAFLFITFSVGLFPTILHVLLKEKYLSQKHNKIAENLTVNIQKGKNLNKNTEIEIQSDNKKEKLNIKLDQIICIKSEGNYASVYYYKDEQITKELIRNSLSKIIQQLIIFENIKRCHRSYIVNFDWIEKISGNARNYNLHISNLEFTIPVSRSFPKSIIQNIKY